MFIQIIVATSYPIFSDRFFGKWQQKWKAQHTANNTLAYSVEVSVVKKWFDKWRACLQLQVLTKTADKHYTSILLKKTYCFLTSKHNHITLVR